MVDASTIHGNLTRVQSRIAEAALRAGRNPDSVRLVAVSKTHPPEAILAAMTWGQRDFGENRPEEGAAKIPDIASRLEGDEPVWHMIGHIQRRKAKLVVAHFDIVHSLDRLSLAQKLNTLACNVEREVPVLLECNVSGEESKSGFQAAGWECDTAIFERMCADVDAILEAPGLRIEGLMTMAPFVNDAETVRPVFASLRGLRDALRERFPQLTLPHLSMGMTNDFEVAIEEGATLVRIGRAIFGTRST